MCLTQIVNGEVIASCLDGTAEGRFRGLSGRPLAAEFHVVPLAVSRLSRRQFLNGYANFVS